MTREQLTGAVAALEEIEQLRNIRTFPLDCIIYLRCKYRAQLAELGPEPAQPWTPRERRLRELLERGSALAEEALAPLWNKNNGFTDAEDELYTWKDSEVPSALADTPPPDAASIDSILASVRRDEAEQAIERMHGHAKTDARDAALERAETKAWNVVMFLDGVHRHKLIENYSSDYARLQEARTDAAELLAAIRAAREGK